MRRPCGVGGRWQPGDWLEVVRTLALSSEGDPLFVRDGRGLDYEIEVYWAGDARLRVWAEDASADEDKLWAKIYMEHPPEPAADGGIQVPPKLFRAFAAVCTEKRFVVDATDESTIVVPVWKLFAASFLPSLEARDIDSVRGRAIVRLGGYICDDEVVSRREWSHRRLWNLQHPKARPPTSAIYVGPHGRMTDTLDERQKRREEVLKRLRNPEPTDAETIQHFLNGLVKRPVA